jgi:hypothetical protein
MIRAYLTRTAIPAALAVAMTACATQPSSLEDRSLQRAYELTASVTGSRIPRKIHPDSGAPSAAYTITTLRGRSARALPRNRPASQNNSD